MSIVDSGLDLTGHCELICILDTKDKILQNVNWIFDIYCNTSVKKYVVQHSFQ